MKRVLILLLVCCSCASPLIKVKKHWDAIQVELLKHPELADSLQLIRHDTLRVSGFKDEEVVTDDSTVWRADFLSEADTLAWDVINAPARSKAVPVTKLQHFICPTLTKDSVYHIHVFNSKLSYWIPVRLSVKVNGGNIRILVSSEDVKIPEPQVEKVLEFKSAKTVFYKDTWFWALVIIAIGAVVTAVLTKRLK